jgi:hypothetical protein
MSQQPAIIVHVPASLYSLAYRLRWNWQARRWEKENVV